MIEYRLRCLELAVAARETDPVAAADRYFTFLRSSPVSPPEGIQNTSTECSRGTLSPG